MVDKRDFSLYNSTYTDIEFSQNMGITKLPVTSVPTFLSNVKASWVSGGGHPVQHHGLALLHGLDATN